MTTKVETKPAAGFQALSGVVPYLTVSPASEAADFYRRALGATEVARHPVDDQGRTMHIHLHVNGGSLMLSDAYPEHGYPLQDHQGCTMTLAVHDGDHWWNRATGAGMTVVTPLAKMFWGDRYGQLRDPYGVTWAIVTPA